MSYNITLANEEEIIAKLEQGGTKLKREFIKNITLDAYGKLKIQATGTKRHHGEYRNSFDWKNDETQGTIFSDLKFAKYVHDGSSPHIIKPRRRKFLKFEINGHTVFAKSVKHPGYRGRHDMEKVIPKVQANASNLFEQACREVGL